MRLSLRFPPSWVLKYAPDEKVAAILPGERLPQAVITYGPMQLVPDEPRPWQAQTLHSDLPPDSKVVVGRTVEVTTSTGWPLRIIEAEVRKTTTEVIEVRLCGFYSFLEHTAVVIVRTENRARMEALGDMLLDILGSGRPDWSGDEATCLADLWGSPPDAATAWTGGEQPAMDHLRQGSQLLHDGDTTDALAELDRALELDPSLAHASFLRGVALGTLADHAGAIDAWTRSLELAPDRVDTLYNRGQARYRTKDFAGALEDFQRTVELAPQDVMVQRKVIQCLYALQRFSEGEAARAAFRETWAASTDPNVRRIHEYVFDQVAGPTFTMFVSETLRPRIPSMPTLLVMSAVDVRDDQDVALPASVLIETSQQARAAGTPFVVCVRDATKTRVVSTLKQLPPYVELKETALTLLQDALKPS